MNKKKWFKTTCTAIGVSALSAFIVGCAEQEAISKQSSAVAKSVPVAQTAVEPANAQAILKRMAEFIANTPNLTVTMSSRYDVLQESGLKVEFAENRDVSISRPNGLRVELEESDGQKHLIVYDGKDITVFSPNENVYAQANKPGGLDEAVMYFLRDLHMRLPLAAMVLSRFPQEVESRLQALDYVERTTMNGKPVHHLVGGTETVDFQVWVEEGDQPLPLRVVLTYKLEEGQPQFRAQFSDWNLTPQFAANAFTFSPPEGTHKIAFLAQLPNVAPEGIATPAQSGEQK